MVLSFIVFEVLASPFLSCLLQPPDLDERCLVGVGADFKDKEKDQLTPSLSLWTQRHRRDWKEETLT